jgi:hypothetical protein
VVYFAGYIITAVNEDESSRLVADLEAEFKNKLKNATDEETREKLRTLLANTKKEIAEIRVGKVLNELSYHHFSLSTEHHLKQASVQKLSTNSFKQMDLEKLKRSD